MTSILFSTLEVAGHYQGKDNQRKIRALADLGRATINGHDVLTVIADFYREPTTIKHFGYDYRCGDDCNHDPAPYGAKRYFGVYLIVSGDWDIATYPLRYWVNQHAQIDITGKIRPYNGQRTELQPTKGGEKYGDNRAENPKGFRQP